MRTCQNFYISSTVIFYCLFLKLFRQRHCKKHIRRLCKKNETVGIQNAQIEQARERVRQVRGGIFPQLYVNGTHLAQPPADDPIAREFFPERQTTVSVTAEQALFRGLREFAGLRQQKDLVAAKEENRRQALLLLYQDVTSAYLNVLTYEQDLKNIEVQIKLYGERVGELRTRVRRGESNASDALTAQSSEAALKAESGSDPRQLKNGAREFRVYHRACLRMKL